MAAKTDPVLQRIHAHPWPQGGVRARRAGHGYSLVSTRTGAPVARLCPTGEDDEVESSGGDATPGDPPVPSAPSCPLMTPSTSSPRNPSSGSGPDQSPI
ncbi:hypothetical protein JL100_024505 [Skermanella mucosa]|nr:hypothetical protein JL100_024505 [Skermanella mucosa]